MVTVQVNPGKKGQESYYIEEGREQMAEMEWSLRGNILYGVLPRSS